MANKLRFASANQALQHLADITGKQVRVAGSTEVFVLFAESAQSEETPMTVSLVQKIRNAESAFIIEGDIRYGTKNIVLVTGAKDANEAVEAYMKETGEEDDEENKKWKEWVISLAKKI